MSKQNSIVKETPKQTATEEKRFVEDIKQIVATAKTQAYRAVNLMQVASNWLLGWRIVEQMQHGQERAEYGAYAIKLASTALTEEFGEGYSVQSLKFYRQFYLTFKDLQIGSTVWSQSQDKKGSTVWSESSTAISQTTSDLLIKIQQTLPAELTWSHFKRLMRVDDEKARLWYMQEAASQQWSYRTLDRNINSQYYYRLLQTPDDLKHEVVDEMKTLTADYQKEPRCGGVSGATAKHGLQRDQVGNGHHRPFAEVHHGVGKRLCLRRPPATDSHGLEGLLHRLGFLQLHPEVFPVG